MKLFEEFKLYENLFWDAVVGKKHPWMKDVPLVYPELNMGSNPNDPESDMILKDYTYLEGPEDVAEVLGNLITEEDVAGTEYDLQTLIADHDAWYDFLDTNFDRLVDKYDEELLNAFEDRAVKAAIREAEDDYYYGNSEYIHESSEDNMARMRRQIRAEIAQLKAEKATDTDPTSAYYYDEKIKACQAELDQLADIAPTKDTIRNRERAAAKAEQAKRVNDIIRQTFYKNPQVSGKFRRVEYASVKGKGWFISVGGSLTVNEVKEFENICSKAGFKVKYNSTHETPYGYQRTRTLFDVDLSSLKEETEAPQNKAIDFTERFEKLVKQIANQGFSVEVKQLRARVLELDISSTIGDAYDPIRQNLILIYRPNLPGFDRSGFEFKLKDVDLVRMIKDTVYFSWDQVLEELYVQDLIDDSELGEYKSNRSIKVEQKLGAANKMKLHEEFRLYENMWDDDPAADSIDEKELDACFTRVTRAAQSSVDDDGELKWIPVKLSKEDLKKALRLGSRGTYTDPSNGITVPAQLVDEVVLCVAGGNGEAGYINLHLQGENPTTGENVVDYCDDIAVAARKAEQDRIFNSVGEFTNYCNHTVIPNADKIAHEMIEQAWAASGLKDYIGITDYNSSYADVTGYKVFYKDNMNNAVYAGTRPECDSFVAMIANMPYAKAHGGLVILSEGKAPTTPSLHEWKTATNQPQQNLSWEDLLAKADALLDELISISGNEDYDDGDGYWSGEEGYEWSNRYLYYSDTLNDSNKLDKLCDVYSNKLPNVVFYYVEDEDICEIGYTATRE